MLAGIRAVIHRPAIGRRLQESGGVERPIRGRTVRTLSVSRDLEQGQKDRARNNEEAVAHKFHPEKIFVQCDRPQ